MKPGKTRVFPGFYVTRDYMFLKSISYVVCILMVYSDLILRVRQTKWEVAVYQMLLLCVLRRFERTKKVKCEKTDAYSMSFALLGADEREKVRGNRCFYIIFYTHT